MTALSYAGIPWLRRSDRFAQERQTGHRQELPVTGLSGFDPRSPGGLPRQSHAYEISGRSFDVDGTLLDTLEDLADSMNGVLRAGGFRSTRSMPIDFLSAREWPTWCGGPCPRTSAGMMPLCPAASHSMVESYGRKWKDKTRPYEGIPELLDELRRRCIRMAILSNKPDEFTRLTVSHLLSRWSFDEVRGERAPTPRENPIRRVRWRSPKPWGFGRSDSCTWETPGPTWKRRAGRACTRWGHSGGFALRRNSWVPGRWL